jgi:hypothetical protein
MNWENHGKLWHIDHIIGCCNYNMLDKNEQKKCFNYRNTRPIFILENLQKQKNIDYDLVKKYNIFDLLPLFNN